MASIYGNAPPLSVLRYPGHAYQEGPQEPPITVPLYHPMQVLTHAGQEEYAPGAARIPMQPQQFAVPQAGARNAIYRGPGSPWMNSVYRDRALTAMDNAQRALRFNNNNPGQIQKDYAARQMQSAEFEGQGMGLGANYFQNRGFAGDANARANATNQAVTQTLIPSEAEANYGIAAERYGAGELHSANAGEVNEKAATTSQMRTPLVRGADLYNQRYQQQTPLLGQQMQAQTQALEANIPLVQQQQMLKQQQMQAQIAHTRSTTNLNEARAKNAANDPRYMPLPSKTATPATPPAGQLTTQRLTPMLPSPAALVDQLMTKHKGDPEKVAAELQASGYDPMNVQ